MKKSVLIHKILNFPGKENYNLALEEQVVLLQPQHPLPKFEDQGKTDLQKQESLALLSMEIDLD